MFYSINVCNDRLRCVYMWGSLYKDGFIQPAVIETPHGSHWLVKYCSDVPILIPRLAIFIQFYILVVIKMSVCLYITRYIYNTKNSYIGICIYTGILRCYSYMIHCISFKVGQVLLLCSICTNNLLFRQN